MMAAILFFRPTRAVSAAHGDEPARASASPLAVLAALALLPPSPRMRWSRISPSISVTRIVIYRHRRAQP